MPHFRNLDVIKYYQEVQRKHITFQGQSLDYLTRPCIPDWESISLSAVLIGDYLDIEPGDHILWLECGHGAVPQILARSFPACRFSLVNSNVIAHALLTQSLQSNGITNAKATQMPTTLSNTDYGVNKVALQAPKGRNFTRRLLSEIHQILPPGGWLYLAGGNKQGIKSINADARQLFGNETLLAYRKGHRLTCYQKSSEEHPKPEWHVQPGILPASWQRICLHHPKGEVYLASMPGIFSSDGVDPGTQFLLHHLAVKPSDTVLDLGCGYGAIGIYAALCGAASVDLVEVNSLAIEASRINITALSLDRVNIFTSEEFQPQRKYSLILSNPPFHRGHDTEFLTVQFFIQLSSLCLEKRGKLLIVANRFLSYGKVMAAYFTHTTIAHEDSHYRIWEAWN